jgi:exodeoxyribonuclease-3
MSRTRSVPEVVPTAVPKVVPKVTVTTINVNGIRAAVKQRSPENLGLLPWFRETAADIVCLQEVRAEDGQLREAVAPVLDQGWHLVGAPSSQKGRNGVAILSRQPIAAARVALEADDGEFDESGRYLEAQIGELTVASIYLPTGEAGTERQREKERFMAAVGARMGVLADTGRDAVICGDWNIGHTERDIKAWKANRKKAGFLPEERQWIGSLLEAGWVDSVRLLHPDADGPYSWWSWRGKAFDNDAGWRIDYQLATSALGQRALCARVERADAYALRWSDHAPVTVQYRLAD